MSLEKVETEKVEKPAPLLGKTMNTRPTDQSQVINVPVEDWSWLDPRHKAAMGLAQQNLAESFMHLQRQRVVRENLELVRTQEDRIKGLKEKDTSQYTSFERRIIEEHRAVADIQREIACTEMLGWIDERTKFENGTSKLNIQEWLEEKIEKSEMKLQPQRTELHTHMTDYRRSTKVIEECIGQLDQLIFFQNQLIGMVRLVIQNEIDMITGNLHIPKEQDPQGLFIEWQKAKMPSVEHTSQSEEKEPLQEYGKAQESSQEPSTELDDARQKSGVKTSMEKVS